ncbi:MFS transporter [Sphingobium sp. RAC03]|uniref:MFS transporter n=1 Tax=Sphingobium sp. RAC03 TaxID=1843368 RepID=UPI00083D5ED6|nr:MFS transporter [Sphingobium sp. RAC03]AOF96838.1 major Facilitator Superfamily protein [Sphingobium sp. RAC03]
MAETGTAMTAGAEWRRAPILPIATGLGYATSVIHIYGLGPYIEPISQSFGWSRTQTTIGLTLATLVQALFSVPIGLMVDRLGPRLFGLVGVVLTCAAFAMLGTATGDKTQWLMLWSLLALATLPVQATVWISAVATRFAASRGLAFAVTLCGASLAAALFPLLGSWLIARHGWQTAAPIQAAIWVAIAFPMIFLFFRGAHDRRAKVALVERQALEGATLAEGVRSSIYHRLLLASLLFTFTIIALVVHFVPILTDRGAERMEAAGIAALVGIFSVIGRLATGLLLDRFRGSMVGAVVFLLPAIGCLLLLIGGESWGAQAAAAAMTGLTLGAEVDVIVYLTTQHFGLKTFGGLYGGLLMALSVGTATGPLGASALYDATGGYGPFLWLTIALMVASSLTLASLPRPAYANGKPQP